MSEQPQDHAVSDIPSDVESVDARRDRMRGAIRADAALPRDELKTTIQSAQAELHATLSKSDGEHANAASQPDDWTARDLLRHVIAVAERVTAQIRSLAANRDPAAYNVPSGEAMQIADAGEPYAVLIAHLSAAHDALLAAIDIAVDGDRMRTSDHAFFGPFTALEWVGFQRLHIGSTLPHAKELTLLDRSGTSHVARGDA